jgi:hypothetical protein
MAISNLAPSLPDLLQSLQSFLIVAASGVFLMVPIFAAWRSL